MPFLRVTIILCAVFLSFHSKACDEDVTCTKCGEKSEFTWNPSNDLVTQQLSRFYEMDGLIQSSVVAGETTKTRKLISENLKLAEVYRCNWNYGNAIHDSNSLLGLMALQEGDVKSAVGYLDAASQSTGSPQLDSFGPDLELANQLLALGENNAVVEYLKGVRTFWSGHEQQIDSWIGSIDSGEDVELN